jgi:hypothetical protein
MTVGVLACIEDDGFLQAGTEPILQEAEAAQVFTTDAGARLDLEAVVAFEDEVYFVPRLTEFQAIFFPFSEL